MMARKFLHSGGKAWDPNPNYDHKTFRKTFYFFYGTLMDSGHLAIVLQSPHRPHLYPAKIVGYSCKLWGPYPALADNPTGAVVCGVAYEVQSSMEEERLKAHETDNYLPRGCLIKFTDGSQVTGKVFKWNGDNSLLKEGTFDLKDWQMNKLEGI